MSDAESDLVGMQRRVGKPRSRDSPSTGSIP